MALDGGEEASWSVATRMSGVLAIAIINFVITEDVQ